MGYGSSTKVNGGSSGIGPCQVIDPRRFYANVRGGYPSTDAFAAFRKDIDAPNSVSTFGLFSRTSNIFGRAPTSISGITGSCYNPVTDTYFVCTDTIGGTVSSKIIEVSRSTGIKRTISVSSSLFPSATEGDLTSIEYIASQNEVDLFAIAYRHESFTTLIGLKVISIPRSGSFVSHLADMDSVFIGFNDSLTPDLRIKGVVFDRCESKLYYTSNRSALASEFADPVVAEENGWDGFNYFSTALVPDVANTSDAMFSLLTGFPSVDDRITDAHFDHITKTIFILSPTSTKGLFQYSLAGSMIYNDTSTLQDSSVPSSLSLQLTCLRCSYSIKTVHLLATK